MASHLTILQDGEPQNLMRYLEVEGEKMYPELGDKTYRVPPVKFQAEKFDKDRSGSYVLGVPAETDQQNNLAENLVCGAFEKLSEVLRERGHGPLFIITNFEYDNYLNKLDLSHLLPPTGQSNKTNDAACRSNTAPEQVETPLDKSNTHPSKENTPPSCSNDTPPSCSRSIKLPRDVAQRGELDGLLLHKKAGVILIEIKSVGHNFGSTSCPCQMNPRDNIRKSIGKAGIQLTRDREVMRHVMGEIGLLDSHMTSLVALPNVTTGDLVASYDEEGRKKLMEDYGLDLSVNFLCQEHFGVPESLYRWWDGVLMRNLRMDEELDIKLMKQIAFRTVGLLSTVRVWSMLQPRVEVRNLRDATVATASSFTEIIISPLQAEVLKREDRFLYIWGTAGTGKTLLLSLKGRAWLRKNRTVIILNTRLGSKGRVIGKVMERSINQSPSLPRKAECVDFNLEDDISMLEEDLTKVIKVTNDPVCFLFDEVTWMVPTINLMDMLKKTYPKVSVWCAGMLEEFRLPGFETQHLENVLRCPPSVQRVLRVIDNNKTRAKRYIRESITAGRSTDGPKPYFVIHSQHGDPNVEPLDCEECSRLVADFLKNKLHIKHPRVTHEEMATQKDSSKSTTAIEDHQPADGVAAHASTASETSTSISPPPPTPPTPQTSLPSPSSLPVPPHSKSALPDSQTIPDQNTPETSKDSKQPKKKKPKRKKKTSTSSSSSSTTATTDANKEIKEGKEEEEEDETLPNAMADQQQCPQTLNNPDSDHPEKSSDNAAATTTTTTSNNSSNKTTKTKNAPGVSTKRQDSQNTTKGPKQNGGGKGNTTGGGSSGGGGNKNNRNRGSGGGGGAGGLAGEFGVVPHAEGLRYRNVVIPVTMPREWHHLNDMKYYSISKEALAQNMVFMGSSRFCTYLLEHEVPLKVEMAMRLTIEGKEEDEHLIMCPAGAVHGLEYKVVICLPSACSTPEVKHFNEGVLQGELGPWTRMELTAFGKKLLEEQTERARRNAGSISTDMDIFNKDAQQPGYTSSGRTIAEERQCEMPIDGVRIATHVEGAPENDVIYLKSIDNGGGDDGVKGSGDSSDVVGGGDRGSSCGGDDVGGGNDGGSGDGDGNKNVINDKVRSTAERSLVSNLSSTFTSSTPPPPTMSTNTTTPTINPAALSPHLQICGFCDNHDSDYCVCEYFEKHELAALNRLRPWEKAYVLMTVSRCTASLVIVLP